jgi:hypothetical protein
MIILSGITIFLLLLLLHVYVVPSNSPDNGTIVVNPSVVQLNIPASQTSGILQTGLLISSERNVTNLKGYFTDLKTNESGEIWISRNSIYLIPNMFNLTAFQERQVDIYLNIHDQVGLYQGSLILQGDGVKITVPIKINIYEYIPWLAFVFVALGMIAAFFLRFIKVGIEFRAYALESLEKAENAALLARLQKRVFGSFEDGDLEWLNAKTHLDNGRYRLARRRFDRAIEYYNSASTTPSPEEGYIDTQRQQLTKEQISNLADQARTKRLKGLGLKDFDSIVIIISSAVLGFLIMEVWNEVYAELSASNITGLWFVTAFLLGFGSESLVGEVVEITRIGQRYQ